MASVVSQLVDDDVQDLADRLFKMARNGDATTLAQYIDAGTPVDLANQNGDTLLMLAAYHGHADAVQVLLERGANIECENDKGQRPLAGAVFKGFDDVVKLLADAGADPDEGSPSALMAAQMFDQTRYIRMFQPKPE